MTFDGTGIWVGSIGSLSRVDPKTGAVLNSIETGRVAGYMDRQGLATTAGSLFVLMGGNRGGYYVAEVDPAGGPLFRWFPLTMDFKPDAICAAAVPGQLWGLDVKNRRCLLFSTGQASPPILMTNAVILKGKVSGERLRVDGVEAPLDQNGCFAHRLPLADSGATVLLETEKGGVKAQSLVRIERGD